MNHREFKISDDFIPVIVTILIGLMCLPGCAYFTNRAKRDLLIQAEGEVDGLIKDHQKGCMDFAQRLQLLKARVQKSLKEVSR